ncbi:response regulator [Thermodesulfobacteriota bacterium]
MKRSKQVSILYVEDDPGQSRLFQKRLQRAGYLVDLAHDGEEGLKKWQSGSYDLLAVDHDMPKKKGLEVIRALSTGSRLPPTVMVTGAGNEIIAVEAMKLGASDYIIKDSEARYLDLIPAVIEQALNKERLVEEKQRAEESLAWESSVNAALADLYIPMASPSATVGDLSRTLLENAKALTASKYGYVGEIAPGAGKLAILALARVS